MKALVISDTHIKRKEDFKELERIIEPFLDGVDVIIHAGDSVIREVVEFFSGLRPTYIVRGNMDSIDMQHVLPEKLVFDFDHFRIGLTHGWGQASGLRERVFELFAHDRVDAIIFGHSHQPYIGRKGNVLMLNPGSPTDTRFADRNTVAILEADGELKAEIINIK
ncbi:MAG TPA: metallophosphoesterase family protein [Anaerolineae bacterium]|nr:metallophosphoesterase family protein [Anaerolineae bacterium]